MSKEGHNSRQEQIQELIVRYVETIESSQELNDVRAGIRENAVGLGLDSGAFQDQVKRAMKDLRKRDGYDQSAKEVADAIGGMDQRELWNFVFERAEKKNKEREEAKAQKEAAKQTKLEKKAA
jgi:hypothetical protein